MDMVTGLWGLLCSEVTSPLNKDSTAMVWFNCAAIKLPGGGGVQILAEMRDFSLLHDAHIGSGTLLASWFVGREGEKCFIGAVVLFNDALCCEDYMASMVGECNMKMEDW
jgi:hypothetical protein